MLPNQIQDVHECTQDVFFFPQLAQNVQTKQQHLLLDLYVALPALVHLVHLHVSVGVSLQEVLLEYTVNLFEVAEIVQSHRLQGCYQSSRWLLLASHL